MTVPHLTNRMVIAGQASMQKYSRDMTAAATRLHGVSSKLRALAASAVDEDVRNAAQQDYERKAAAVVEEVGQRMRTTGEQRYRDACEAAAQELEHLVARALVRCRPSPL